MKRKSYVMPIVLLIFALLIISFFSIYYRTISTHNNKNSKEISLLNKLRDMSLEEILSTKATLNFVNSKLNNRENFSLEINIDDLLKINNISDYPDYFKDYKIVLNSKRFKRQLNFYDKRKNKIPYFVRQYEIFFTIKKNNKYIEYKFVDKNRIENYLFDLQVKNFVDGNIEMLSKDFYFNLDKDFLKLYERVFSDENKGTYSKNLRIYDYKDKICFVDDEQYLKLLKFYLLNNKIELKNEDINLCELDEFLKDNKLNNCSKNDFIETLLLGSSDYLKDGKLSAININITDRLYFDFDKDVEFYANLKLENDSGKVIVTNKIPKVQGIFVNNSENTEFDFMLEGILFSKNKLKSKYKFLPDILDITARFVKISEDFYFEKIEKNDVK